MRKGPKAYARMKLERQSERRNALCICNAPPITLNAGATIEVEIGEMKVYAETTMVTVHLRRYVQFLGLAGSSGPSQVTFWYALIINVFEILTVTMPETSYLPGLVLVQSILVSRAVPVSPDHGEAQNRRVPDLAQA